MRHELGIGESRPARVTLVLLAAALVGVLLLTPLLVLFVEAARAGFDAFMGALTDPDAASAIRLTLLVAAIVVPLNTVFGVAAAWCLSRYRFSGRAVLVTLLALPFTISPVVTGLGFVLLFGGRGWFGPLLSTLDIKIMFALPGIVLATTFVTVPFVAGQLIPLLRSLSTDQEEAALVLGATGGQMFRRVTLPRIKWGLLYGVLLCSARSMGEFGAVSVVSGRIRGLTNTMPLHIEVLYQQYDLPAAFAVASLLAMIAVLTIAVRAALEWRLRRATRVGAEAQLAASL